MKEDHVVHIQNSASGYFDLSTYDLCEFQLAPTVESASESSISIYSSIRSEIAAKTAARSYHPCRT